MTKGSGRSASGKSSSKSSSSKSSSTPKLKAYLFPNRNTPVIARTADQARAQKQRPKSDRIVAVRSAKPGEGAGTGKKSERWSRLRRDGQPPGKSKYGKGRGQGPERS